jgi:acyl-coenzyme A synthetase/AMP-(fatty) acid ligase
VHSVVFAGFSSEALASRIQAAESEYLVTADHGVRAGKRIPVKDIVNVAVDHVHDKNLVKKVLVWERKYDGPESEAPYDMQQRDVRFDILVENQRPYCTPVQMDAEDNLFILYTSGSTGYVTAAGTVCDGGKEIAPKSQVSHICQFKLSRHSLFVVISGRMPKGLVHTTGGYALYVSGAPQHFACFEY